MNGFLGGLQIRHLDRGQTPVADYLCTACGTYRRVTGRAKVADFVRANPITEHRAVCRPTKTNLTAARHSAATTHQKGTTST